VFGADDDVVDTVDVEKARTRKGENKNLASFVTSRIKRLMIDRAENGKISMLSACKSEGARKGKRRKRGEKKGKREGEKEERASFHSFYCKSLPQPAMFRRCLGDSSMARKASQCLTRECGSLLLTLQ
jgi:hypothetical protein